ncbi:MAG TPA: TAXI family TRAP transporter solute-binding subunit [Stellaceae bacterium]|nr:TAXI family TRAP transporter solute-binding subunit [Stellaceae bacterium]
MLRRAALFSAWVACGLAFGLPAAAQSDNLKRETNRGVIGVISGGVDGTYVRIAADLSAVLEEPGTLRVLPVLGKGSVQNLADLLYLRGIDVGIVQSDVLAYVRREKLYPGLESRVQYIAKLYNEELHLLAGKDINSVNDLAGKTVNFDVKGSGTYMTATLIFDALHIKVVPVSDDQALALEKVRKGETAALVYVAGKPARLFRDLKAEDGVHFLPIPQTPEILQTYLPSQLTPADYQLLSAPIDTVAVGAVMAVISFPPQSERYHNLARFAEAFFSKFPSFLEAPRHPKWKEVNLSAQLPGWTRFPPAEAWLKRQGTMERLAADTRLRQAFDAFLDEQSKAIGRVETAEQKKIMFEQFLRWQEKQPQLQ